MYKIQLFETWLTAAPAYSANFKTKLRFQKKSIAQYIYFKNITNRFAKNTKEQE